MLPLVGREREQGMLQQALDDMFAGNGSLAVVSGEAGIGKTTLIDWLATEAEQRGCLVLRGGCYDLTTTPPYGPWIEITRRYPRDSNLPSRPAFLGDRQALQALHNQNALFEQTLEFFADVAATCPLLLVLEDLHWADQSSLDLLRACAREIRASRLLLIATHRDDELDTFEPFARLMLTVTRESKALRIVLRRLDHEAIDAVARRRYQLPDSDQERLVEYLEHYSEGHPLFLTELLRSLEDESALELVGTNWRLLDLELAQVPNLIQQVILHRFDRLDPEIQQLLSIGAVIGQQIPLLVWEQVSQAESQKLLQATTSAVARHMIEELPDGTGWQFVHSLIRETLYRQIPLLLRRSWHREIAEVLARRSVPDPDFVAEHFRLAGDDRAIDWLLRAADRAEESYALVVAAERLEAALPSLAKARMGRS